MIFLRACAFNIYFFGLTTLMAMGGVFVRLFRPKAAYAYARAWVRLVLAGLAAICGVRAEIIGREHLPPEGPALLASQHQSAFDTLIWMTLLPATAYVVKRELTWIPLFGPLLELAGMIPVDRRKGAAALRHLTNAASTALAAGRQIVIFPEGTRVAPGKRVKLQPGIAAIAKATQLPVVPVATDSGRYWRRRAFMKYPGTIHVVIGPALPMGLPKEALLAGIEGFWREAEAVHGLVDNSVE